MNLDDVIRELGLSDSREALSVEWEESQQAMPRGEVPFLTADFVAGACTGVFLPDEISARAVSAARKITAVPALRALAWHCHWCFYRSQVFSPGSADAWPVPQAALDDDAGMFYLLVLISHVPRMQAAHRARGLPEKAIRESVAEIHDRGVMNAERLGAWGLSAHDARWLTNILRDELHRLGRLSFQSRTLDGGVLPFRIYRRRRSSEVAALCLDGVGFCDNGHRPAPGTDAAEPTWRSRLAVREDEIVGNPVLPTGVAVRDEVRLDASEWSQELAPGDAVLVFHIPGGQPLDHERCGESFRRAREFFPRYFPDWPFRAFWTSSWILDTNLERWLAPESNLVRFQREFYLVPGAIRPTSLFRGVFDRTPEDMATAARETALQRAILDDIADGNPYRPHAGRGFLLPEDLDWGAQVYRKSRFPHDLVPHR